MNTQQQQQQQQQTGGVGTALATGAIVGNELGQQQGQQPIQQGQQQGFGEQQPTGVGSYGSKEEVQQPQPQQAQQQLQPQQAQQLQPQQAQQDVEQHPHPHVVTGGEERLGEIERHQQSHPRIVKSESNSGYDPFGQSSRSSYFQGAETQQPQVSSMENIQQPQQTGLFIEKPSDMEKMAQSREEITPGRSMGLSSPNVST